MNSSASPRFVRAFAIGGALAFAASMIVGAAIYGTSFGVNPPRSTSARAVAIDIALFAVFALHHSLFARTGLKHHIRRWAGADVERSTYVWIASGLFLAMVMCWQPVSGVFWHASGVFRWVLAAMQLSGACLMLAAGRLTDVRDLAGLGPLRRVPKPPADVPVSRGPYNLIRHPLYLAFLLLLWPVGIMTGTRLLFAALFTIYVLLAIPLEERDLRRGFGGRYDDYAGRVRYRLVPGVY